MNSTSPEWLFHIISLAIGIIGGVGGAYVGIKMGLTRLEVYVEDARRQINVMTKNIQRHNDDLLIHDTEIEDVMRKLDLQRKRRQNWRFE